MSKKHSPNIDEVSYISILMEYKFVSSVTVVILVCLFIVTQLTLGEHVDMLENKLVEYHQCVLSAENMRAAQSCSDIMIAEYGD